MDALNYSLWLLGKRDYSIGKLKQKLTVKKFSSGEIENAIKFLSEKNFLNDERFARNYVRNYLDIKPAGKYLLQQKLKQKLIDNNVIEKVLKDMDTRDEIDLAKEAAGKKYQVASIKYQGDKIKIKEYLARYLIGRGFSWEMVKEIISNY